MFIRDDRRVAVVQPSHGRTNQHVVDMSTQGLNMRNHCGCTLRISGDCLAAQHIVYISLQKWTCREPGRLVMATCRVRREVLRQPQSLIRGRVTQDLLTTPSGERLTATENFFIKIMFVRRRKNYVK